MCIVDTPKPKPALVSAASAQPRDKWPGISPVRRFASGPAGNILTSPVGIVGNSGANSKLGGAS